MATVGPALNYKKSEQVWDNFHTTIFTLGCISREIKMAGQEAADLAKKVCGEGGREEVGREGGRKWGGKEEVGRREEEVGREGGGG